MRGLREVDLVPSSTQQRGLREMTDDYVGGGGLHSALRETQRRLADRRVLGTLAVVAALLGFAGPFGTFETLDLPARLVYWAAVAFASYAIAVASGTFLRHWLAERLRHPALRVILIGVLAGLPVTVAALIINLVTFGPDRGWRIVTLPVLWLDATLITLGVLTISTIVKATAHQPMIAAEAPVRAPALLDRIPLPQRGALTSLSVTDHYVEVTTSRGKALLLMRLSDAIREASPTPGLRIHRSHWVALDAVARALRADGKLVLELKDGRRLPVSRSHIHDARAAGLLV